MTLQSGSPSAPGAPAKTVRQGAVQHSVLRGRQERGQNPAPISGLPGIGTIGAHVDKPTSDAVQLKEALAREAVLLDEKARLLTRQEMLAQEFEHRLLNSMQLIVSLLSLQSRKTGSAEAAAQLMIAAARVGALGRVHRRLHLLDHQETVEFKHYVEQLCEDLSGMLFETSGKRAILVEGEMISIPTKLGIPLGFIVNELVTNSAKHGIGEIRVRLATVPGHGYSLSVCDEGPGLPENFDPAASTGLGMKLVQSLIGEIGGKLTFGRGDDRRGAFFTVLFDSAAIPTIVE
jgi:two-component sensor histidine kinase